MDRSAPVRGADSSLGSCGGGAQEAAIGARRRIVRVTSGSADEDEDAVQDQTAVERQAVERHLRVR
jgi:hypothetical protein